MPNRDLVAGALEEPIDPRILLAPNAYTTRRVPREAMRCLLRDVAPRAGDLVLARIEALGHHTRLHLPNGARQRLFVGDDVIVAYGNRYAASQFEAMVPDSLEPCELIAGGGLAGRVLSKHKRIRKGATRIAPLGLVAHEADGPPLNVSAFSLAPPPFETPSLPTIGLVGTGMDSGKTTAAAYLTRGLKRCGMKVGYAKVTGTGASCDSNLLRDAGADVVLDFTDVGYASTFRESAEAIWSIFVELNRHVRASDVDAVLIEVADGLLQSETSGLLRHPEFTRWVDSLLFAANDGMGAVAGTTWLASNRLPMLGLTGAIESAPLQVREAREATCKPVYGSRDLGDPTTASKLLQAARDSVALRA